jgi:hypothetical protein
MTKQEKRRLKRQQKRKARQAARPEGAFNPLLPATTTPPVVRENVVTKRDSVTRRATPDRPLDVYLGVDLGTGFTKVVWRLGDSAYPLCFGNCPDKITDYLVPSLVYFDGEFFETGVERGDIPGPDAGTAIRNFKMCLACESARGNCGVRQCPLTNWKGLASCAGIKGQEASLVTALFLSRVLARTRSLICDQLKQRFNANQVRWSAILAVPEKHIEQSPVRAAFEKVFKAAWVMSRVPNLTCRDEVLERYEIACREAEKEELDVFVYPEVSAEAASVTRSRVTEDGLFAFVDVGAGTVDASVFRLYTPPAGNREHNTYTADVLKLGAAHIETEASRELSRAALGWFKEMKERQPPEFTTKAKNPSALLLPVLDEMMKRLQRRVKSELIRLFDEARRKENLLSRWEDLQLILGGGGASLSTYQRAALEAFTLKYAKSPMPPTVSRLPVPKDFRMERLSPDYFHRFAVAYGLAFEYVNLHEFALSGQVSALSPPRESIVTATGKDEC